jgi:hypothetical protein
MFTEWFLSQSPLQTIGVSFDNLLTEASISHIGWAARISNFNRMLLRVISNLENVVFEEAINNALNGLPLGSRQERQTEVIAVTTSFLELIGLVERGETGVRLTKRCLRRLGEMFEEFGPVADKIIDDGPQFMATALILFHMFKMANSAGIPGPLLEKSVRMLAELMRLSSEDGSAEHPEQVDRCSTCNQPI